MSSGATAAAGEGSALLSRANLPPILILCGLGISVGVAVFGWQTTAIAASLPAAAVLAWFLIPRPTATMIVLVAIEAANVAEVVDGPTGVGHLGIMLGIATIAYALRDPAARARLNRGVLWCVGLITCYLVPQFIALLGSQNFEVSVVQLRTMVIDCVYLVTVLILVMISGKPWAAVAAMVVPLAVLSLLCLINQAAFGGTATFGGFAMVRQEPWGLIELPRYGGPTVDANFWGRILVLGIPLAGALAVRAWQSGRRIVALYWFAAMIAISGGVYLTQSRGAYIAAAFVLILWILASGPRTRLRGLLSLPFLALVLLVPGVGNRLFALMGDLLSSNPYRVVDPSVVGRQAVQEISWAMFRERPLFGFGPNVF
jgi:O-antigen ligase